MNGLSIGRSPVGNQSDVSLLAKHDSMEIVHQRLKVGGVVWLVPAQDCQTIEFYFIHRGKIEIVADTGSIYLSAGDYFSVQGLVQEVLLKTLEEAELVYMASFPVYDDASTFQSELTQLLRQITEKDQYTYEHSRNVMRYTTSLYEVLGGPDTGISLDDIVVAALFHDVGKCFVPDEVLKKPGRLTPEEYAVIQQHPQDSAKLLLNRFSSAVAEAAANHHERLDGSGYPRGIDGTKISLPARIVAVADCFDAMTSNRGYNRVKPMDEAAAELNALSHQFDSGVTQALCELVQNGIIHS